MGISITDFDLGTRRLCLPGPVEILDASKLDLFRYMQREIFRHTLERPIVAILNAQLRARGIDAISFAAQLKQAAETLRQPIDLKNQLWLSVNPIRVLVSQFQGAGKGSANAVTVTAGVQAQPVLTYGAKPGPSGNADLGFVVADGLAGQWHLLTKGVVQLADARTALKEAVKTKLTQQFAGKPFYPGNVDLYQSGEKLVVALSLVNRSDQLTVGTIYLWATPKLDVSNAQIKLTDVDFDVDAGNIIGDYPIDAGVAI